LLNKNEMFWTIQDACQNRMVSQYVQGHKKPSNKQTKKILEGINQIGLELSEINLIYK